MGNVGWFFPILVICGVLLAYGLALLDKWLSPNDSETYEIWLEEKLDKNPDYIDWLKVTNGGKDYHLGLKVLNKVERDKNRIYHKLFRIN